MITYIFTSKTFSGQTIDVQYSKYSSNTRLDLGSGTFPFSYTTDQKGGTYYFYIPSIDRTYPKTIDIPPIDIYTEEINVPECDLSGVTIFVPPCDVTGTTIYVPVCDIEYELDFIKPTQTPTLTPTIPACRCYNISNSGPNSYYNAIKCNEIFISENQILANTSQQKCFREGSVIQTQFITAVPNNLCNNCGNGVFSCGTCPTPTQTPTPTVTITPSSNPDPEITVPLCSVLYNTGTNIYFYEVSSNTKTFLGSLTASTNTGADIAHTTNYIWTSNSNLINEWSVTLSPFSSNYIRQMSTPHQIGPGLGSINDFTLIAVDSSELPNKVVLLDISTDNVTSTYQFDMIQNRKVSGDILYTTTDKVIITNYNVNPPSSSYVTQYNFSTGEVEVDIVISPIISNPFGVFVDNDEIFIANGDGNIYNISKNPPYTITLTGDTDTQIAGASQVPQCINTNFNF